MLHKQQNDMLNPFDNKDFPYYNINNYLPIHYFMDLNFLALVICFLRVRLMSQFDPFQSQSDYFQCLNILTS